MYVVYYLVNEKTLIMEFGIIEQVVTGWMILWTGWTGVLAAVLWTQRLLS